MRCEQGKVAAVNEKQTGASNRKHRPGAMSWLAVGRPIFNRAYFLLCPKFTVPQVHCAPDTLCPRYGG